MLYKVVLTFETVNEILKCDYSWKAILGSTSMWYWLFIVMVLTFESVDEILIRL